jgi:ferrous iron transport protein B
MFMKYTIALAGNPNSGKTTLFNQLTGARAHVGNWPGVTVEKKEGSILRSDNLNLIDLPGIYSLSPYTLEEVIARNYLLKERPDVIINIVDATNLERNLYLTTQIVETGIPTVIACNMIDLVNQAGDYLNSKALSAHFGAPVVEISALRGDGLDELVSAVKEAASSRRESHYVLHLSKEVEAEIKQVEKELETTSSDKLHGMPRRWWAQKLLEQDEKALEEIPLSSEQKARIDALEEKLDDDVQSVISTARFKSIAAIMDSIYTCKNPHRLSLSDRIDKIVTNRILALPIFVLVMFLVYYLSISTIGTLGTDYVNDVVVGEWAQGGVEALLTNLGASDWIIGLTVDGVIGGVGAVLGFLPQMAVLFLLLSILELSGYMARIAFILDRIFRKFGLSGKSFIPMLIGTGCSVPGIMASRTIEQEADRRMTAITTSFVPCGAKLPIIAFIAGALFSGAWWFAPICYFVGVAAVIVSGIVLKKTRGFAGDPAPFVMELPEYRLPTFKGVLLSVWERSFAFVKKAGTIILLSSIVLWFLQAYGVTSQGIVAVEDAGDSILAVIGGAIAWLFIPLGFGDWQSTVATFTGLIAKENVMSTFAIVFGVQGDVLELIEAGEWSSLAAITQHYTMSSAFSFLLFQLLCAPCFAAIGAMHRELGNAKWTLFAVAYQTAFAYSFSLIYYQFALLFSGNPFTPVSAVAIVVLLAWFYLLFRKKPIEQGKLQVESV